MDLTDGQDGEVRYICMSYVCPMYVPGERETPIHA